MARNQYAIVPASLGLSDVARESVKRKVEDLSKSADNIDDCDVSEYCGGWLVGSSVRPSVRPTMAVSSSVFPTFPKMPSPACPFVRPSSRFFVCATIRQFDRPFCRKFMPA